MEEPLLQLPCFSGVARDEARLLLRNTELTRLSAGQSVLLGRGPAQELLLVVEGELQALGDDGWVAGPGSVLGGYALLSRRQGSGFRTTRASVVAYASVHQARALMTGSAAFATALAVSLCQELDARVASERQSLSAR
jgi:CRP-like cAMP-binding protein